MRKTKILIACFLTVFAAVGAGYAFLLRQSESRLEQTERAYGVLTGEDTALAVEELERALLQGQLHQYGVRELGQIISASSRAATAVGYLRRREMRRDGLLAFFEACERTALDRLSGRGDEQILDALLFFAQKINSAVAGIVDGGENYEMENILTDPGFETLMQELGMADFASGSDFRTVVGMEIDEREAKEIGERYLGKNYGFKVSESPLVYTVYATNVSASVTKKGGYLMQLMFDLPDQELKLSREKAEERMTEFLSCVLSESGILLPGPTVLDGFYRRDFYPERNGIICIDERISVGVTAGSGRVCLFDAGDYYRSRGGETALPASAKTAQEISELWGGKEAIPCKVRTGAGVETVCFLVEDFFVDAVDGERLNIKE